MHALLRGVRATGRFVRRHDLQRLDARPRRDRRHGLHLSCRHRVPINGIVPTGDHWIIGKKIAVHHGGKLDGYMTYKADATDYPKTIDLTPDWGPAKGKVLKGIYDLDGNTLKICYVSPTTEEPEKSERPKEIGAKGTVTLVFGRVLP